MHGFRYFDSRDLMGFVDGTENPVADEGAAAVVIDEQDPDVAGGTYAMIQKYLHDLDAWNAISVEDQELAIGRRKLDGVELDDATKPGDAHTRLTVVSDDDGEELAILRDKHAVRDGRQRRVRHLLRRVRRRSRRARADAAQHGDRRPRGVHRPDPGLLHRRHPRPGTGRRSRTSAPGPT